MLRGCDNWLLIPKRTARRFCATVMPITVSFGVRRQASAFRFRAFVLETVASSCSYSELIGMTRLSGKELGSAPAKAQHIWFSFCSQPCVACVCLCPISRAMGSRWEARFLSLSKAGTAWKAGGRELWARAGSPGIHLHSQVTMLSNRQHGSHTVCDPTPPQPCWHEKI